MTIGAKGSLYCRRSAPCCRSSVCRRVEWVSKTKVLYVQKTSSSIHGESQHGLRAAYRQKTRERCDAAPRQGALRISPSGLSKANKALSCFEPSSLAAYAFLKAMAATLTLPGDHVRVPSTSAVKLGPGLAICPAGEASKEEAELIATAPGVLGQLQSSKAKGKNRDTDQQTAVWVESNAKRYVPSLHDHVLCQITNRGVDSYQVTLLTTFTPATLPALSFEGATKRNKPNLRVGTLLYAQVVSAHRHLEVELTCVDPTTGKSNGFGELKTERDEAGASSASKGDREAAANIWPVSCGLARSLLNPGHPLLARLANHFPFEVAIGVNGFVWVRAQKAQHVIAMGKVLEQADLSAAREPAGGKDALEMAKVRGALNANLIAKIVEPFK